MKTSAIVDQFREEGYAIVRQLFDGEDVLRLQRETADLYQAGIEHPVTYKHGNLAYEILPEKHFDQRYMIQAYWFAWVNKYFDEFRSDPAILQLLEPFWVEALNKSPSRFIGSHRVQLFPDIDFIKTCVFAKVKPVTKTWCEIR